MPTTVLHQEGVSPMYPAVASTWLRALTEQVTIFVDLNVPKVELRMVEEVPVSPSCTWDP